LRTVQSNILTASVEPGDGLQDYRVNVNSGGATLFAVPGTHAPAVLLDGEPCAAAAARLGNAEGYSIGVPAGRHVVSLQGRDDQSE
jgi:hypothetical protein